MNEDPQALERILDQATASTGPPECEMDPQVAALREAWRVWGRLLQAAETPMEPAAVGRTARRFARPRRLAAAALVAVALAIVAATAWIAVQGKGSGVSFTAEERALDSENASLRREKDSRPPGPSAKTPSVAARRPPAALTTGESQWDDLFDDQIARVGQELICVQQDWSLRADAFDLVRSRLEEMHAEIETGQL